MSFLVCREVEQNETKVLRIVDFSGDKEMLRYISSPIQTLIDANQYEYVDFYQFGIEDKIMKQVSFVK